jgi:hypothetical protein
MFIGGGLERDQERLNKLKLYMVEPSNLIHAPHVARVLPIPP